MAADSFMSRHEGNIKLRGRYDYFDQRDNRLDCKGKSQHIDYKKMRPAECADRMPYLNLPVKPQTKFHLAREVLLAGNQAELRGIVETQRVAATVPTRTS